MQNGMSYDFFREKVDGEGQKRGFILLQPLDLGTNQPYETNLDCENRGLGTMDRTLRIANLFWSRAGVDDEVVVLKEKDFFFQISVSLNINSKTLSPSSHVKSLGVFSPAS